MSNQYFMPGFLKWFDTANRYASYYLSSKSIPMLTPRPVIKEIYDLVSSVQVKSIDAYVDFFSKH